MQKLLQKAVNSLQNARIAEVAPVKISIELVDTREDDDDDDYDEYDDDDEGCDCEEILKQLNDASFEKLTISEADYESTEYLCDDEAIFDFATAILEGLNVPDEEIDNYMCGTTLDDCFLDFEEDGEGGIDVTVNIPALYEFLVDVEEAY